VRPTPNTSARPPNGCAAPPPSGSSAPVTTVMSRMRCCRPRPPASAGTSCYGSWPRHVAPTTTQSLPQTPLTGWPTLRPATTRTPHDHHRRTLGNRRLPTAQRPARYPSRTAHHLLHQRAARRDHQVDRVRHAATHRGPTLRRLHERTRVPTPRLTHPHRLRPSTAPRTTHHAVSQSCVKLDTHCQGTTRRSASVTATIAANLGHRMIHLLKNSANRSTDSEHQHVSAPPASGARFETRWLRW
jgi:hypothetical protein